MSRAALHKLVRDARKELEGSNKLVGIREQFNRQPHVYVVNSGAIKSQILDQIKRKRTSITQNQNEGLDTIVYEYTKALYGTFKFRKSQAFDYSVFGNDKDFYVVVTSKSNNSSDIYKQIYKIRQDRLSTLRNKVVKLFPKVSKEDTEHLLEIGHMTGHGIAEVRIQRALSELTSSMGRLKQEGADSVLNLIMSSYQHSNGKILKEFHMYVEDEAIANNKGQKLAGENKLLVEARKVLDEFLANNVDWANQQGSDSAVDIAISELLRIAKQSGAKVNKNPSTRKSKSNTITDKAIIKSKTKPKPPVVIKDTPIEGIDIPNSYNNNWASLIEIINRKLPEQVANNMGIPGLIYRTGRFAHSTKVLAIEKTKEGYPSIVYDYQRDPYDVFDRVKGASPWNTPARDPRALVDKSVREIVQEMAIGRFYTRRA